MKQILILALMVFLLVAGWLFAAANTDSLTVNYLVGRATLSISWWLLVVFVIGFVLGVVYCGASLVRARLANRRLRDRCDQQESELHKLNAQLARQSGR